MTGPVATVRRTAQEWRWGRRPLPPADLVEITPEPPAWKLPTRWVRSRPAAAVREGIQTGALAPLLTSQVVTVVEGRDRVEEAARNGPVILAPNHSSHLDAPTVLISLPKQVRRRTVTLAASDYFFDAWWRAAATALVFNAAPIDRRPGGRDGLPVDLLEEGYHLLVFPEGTRSHDGYASRFRSGAGHLAVEHGVAVVPVAIDGTWRAMPRGQGWPSRGRPRVRISYGHPLRAEPGETANALTRRVERAVAVLLDEQRTDWWSAMRADHAGRTPSLRGPAVAAWRRRWALLEPDPPPQRRRVWSTRSQR
ncbi:lysophospholipid acyltransferase family protein [Nitriliruptor alkaliphilus]|uniref:lysophospholipid acyltransferase family protein n=1 Tax=Nitriliruptor alkaliphilus TaxID=427918 RepID=UPI000695D46B|nr:lysophospholipid acyltransferase family protein [Nitriliruptor alkaliphilus]